jgi:hypothetical protein
LLLVGEILTRSYLLGSEHRYNFPGVVASKGSLNSDDVIHVVPQIFQILVGNTVRVLTRAVVLVILLAVEVVVIVAILVIVGLLLSKVLLVIELVNLTLFLQTLLTASVLAPHVL